MTVTAIQPELIKLAAATGQTFPVDASFPAAHRLFVLAESDVLAIQVLSPRQALPALPMLVRRGGREYRAFELPAIVGGEGHSVEIELAIERGGVTELIALEVPASYGRPGDDDDGTDDDSTPTTICDLLQLVLDEHIEVATELVDETRSKPLQWEGMAESIAVRHLDHVLASWQAASDGKEPRLALIVRFAQQLPQLVRDLCTSPRRVLSRSREIQPVGRIQQVDSGCLRWLARQPGRSVSEKAGPRQQVLGIVRMESFDTPENRVLRDYLVRCARAATRYVREYGSAFADHERVVQVRQFRRLVQEMLRHSPIGKVSALAGTATANYVLLHDARYSRIWEAYQKLIRQEQEIDDAWSWRQRIWVEHSLLALSSAAHDVIAAARPVPMRLPMDVHLHGNQVCGRFIAREFFAGARFPDGASGTKGLVVFDLHAGSLPTGARLPEELTSLAADLAVCRLNERGRVIAGMLVLCCVQSAVASVGQDPEELSRIDETLARTNWRVLLLQWSAEATPAEADKVSPGGRVRTIRTHSPLQNHRELLAQCTRWGTHP